MFLAELHHAIRRLLSRPGISVTAVAMLGLAIGIATAMFAALDALVLRPVPFHAPQLLAAMYMADEHGALSALSPTVLDAWRDSGAFANVESAQVETALIERDGSAVTRNQAWVTPGVFEMLDRVRPLRGRLFEAGEGRAGSEDRVLLSESVWRALYNADPTIIGQRVTIDGAAVTVVGVLPVDFHFPSWDTALWRPIDFRALPQTKANERARVYARFAAGIPRPDALRIATASARAADPTLANREAQARPISTPVGNQDDWRAVPLLTGSVVLVFFLLCGNVGGLLLARFAARHREFGICAALGASHGRLMREAFVECSVLGAAGIVVGLGVSWAFLSLAGAALPDAYLLRTLHPLGLDPRAFGMAATSGIIATLAAGLIPTWLTTRADAGSSLRGAEQSGTDGRIERGLLRALLIGEVAFACMLLVVATLLVRSFINLEHADRGLEARGAMTAQLSLPKEVFPDPASRQAAAQVIEDRIRQLPGVERLAWSHGVPPAGSAAFSFGEWFSDLPGAAPTTMTVDRYNAGSDFFALYGIPVLRGRTFQAGDTDTEVVVGERMAHALWGNLDPIGHTLSLGIERFTVIGVVREINYPSLNAELDRPEFYQRFNNVGREPMLSVRCRAACPDTGLLRQRLLAARPGLKVLDVRRIEDVYVEQFAQPRATAALGLTFAAIALTAAGCGLFCVLNYAVGRRRREFGIRFALGASPAQVRRIILRDALVVFLSGLVIGTVAARALARGVASVQYGVTVNDPVSWTIVFTILSVATLSASWRPARDAMRVDPARLLREP